jgi:hypothetical protein
VVALSPDQGWSVAAAEVSAADQAAGAKISMADHHGLVRATIASPVSREVAWNLRFRTGPKTAAPPATVNDLKVAVEMGSPVTLTWTGGDGVVYEVRREPGEAAMTSTQRLADDATEPGKTYRYSVTAVDWAGQRSASREVSVTTPQMPPVPPKPAVSVTALKPLQASVGWGKLQTGKAVSGKPLCIAGKTYEDGLGVHAVSRVVYARQPEFKRFVAVAGLDEGIRENNRSSVVMKVLSESGRGAELRTLASSPLLIFGKCEQWHFDVELPADCRKVHLTVEDGGDGVNSDHADWVDAGFH